MHTYTYRTASLKPLSSDCTLFELSTITAHLLWSVPSAILLCRLDGFPSYASSSSSSSSSSSPSLPPPVSPGPSSLGRASPSWLHMCIQHSQWWAWVVGGHAASITIYRAALALSIVVSAVTRQLMTMGSGAAAATTTTKLITAVAAPMPGLTPLGIVAPVLIAPLWEEVLYRGFVFPWLAVQMLPDQALVVQALFFAAHHRAGNALASVPLAALGWLWGKLYLVSGNLWIPTLTHMLWNLHVLVTPHATVL